MAPIDPMDKATDRCRPAAPHIRSYERHRTLGAARNGILAGVPGAPVLSAGWSSDGFPLGAVHGDDLLGGFGEPRRDTPPARTRRRLSWATWRASAKVTNSALTPRDYAALTPLIWSHVNAYGRFDLDMNARMDLAS